MLEWIWTQLKVWRGISFGPITLRFKCERSVRVTRGGYSPGTRRMAHVNTGIRERGFAQVHEPAPARSEHAQPTLPGTAVIVGVGPGFGYALARHAVAEGFDVVLVSRDASKLDPLVAELRLSGRTAASYGCDATDERAVNSLLTMITDVHGVPTLVVYSVQEFGPGQTIDLEVPAFESAWKHNCLGAFLVGRAAARGMKASGRGTILFVGSTSSIVGRAGHLNLAVGKFGQRALSQVLSRELWPLGIHVAHAIIDADIAESGQVTDAQASPDDIAYSLIAVHRQPRTAWTSEIDLRPWNEKFWEHC